MASQKPSRSVFVGNIPYDATEEQLRAICEQVGPVVSFRLVADRETGKAKGFGFCEYKDEETAQSARRNLQGHDINGRQLRVDFAENEKGGSGGAPDRMPRGSVPAHQLPFSYDQPQHSWIPPTPPTQPSDTLLPAQQPVGHAAASAAAAAVNGSLGGVGSPQQPPSSGPANAEQGGSDPLTNQLAGMSKQQLYELLSQMKVLIQTNHAQARAILVANPQLTKGLFQAQVMLGMVKPIPLPASPQPPAQPRPAMHNQVQQAPPPQPPPHTYQQQQSTPAPPPHQPPPRPSGPPPPSQYQVPNQPPPQLPAVRPPPTQPTGYPPPTGQPRYQQAVAAPSAPPMAYGQAPQQQHQMQPQQYQMNRSAPQQQIQPTQRPVGQPGSAGPAPPPPQPMQAGGLAVPIGYPGQTPQHSMYSQGGVPPPTMQAATGSRLPPPPPQAQPPPQAMDLEQQKQLLQQVMQLTPDQINSLPPEQRAQVLQLQQALR